VILLYLLCGIAAGYQLTAVLAALAHLRKREPVASAPLPPISVLKPVRGADAGFDAAIRSHALLDYPEHEVLFGVREMSDPAVAHVQELMRQFPASPLRLIHCPHDAPNAKVGTLEQLATQARFDVFVVNDADIRVERDYLQRLARALDGAGVVTCLYRASGASFAARFEALGIATDFAPSALVAPFTGVREFGLGSTLAFRRSDLERAGGFAAIRDHIADDYQIGKRISSLGLRVRLSKMTVETFLGAGTSRDVWRHQVRWARTIRFSRGAYYGLPVTFATVWSAVALLSGHWHIGAALLALRLASALLTGVGVLRDPVTARLWWLVPVRDVWGAAVWLAGAFGSTVEWRGQRIRLDRDGRIVT
jgi:ceramide glucosyltransferase